MARNEQLNNTAIGIAVLGGILFLIGLFLFLGTFMGTARVIENAGREMGLLGSPLRSSAPPLSSALPLSSVTIYNSSGSTRLSTGGTSILGPSRPSPNIGAAIVGTLFMGAGGFLIKLAIGMGLVANAKPIARWVGDVTSQIGSQQGRYQAFRSQLSVQKVKVRCSHCAALNNEDARFCSQCGKKLVSDS